MRALFIFLILVISTPVLAETVMITASQDNTIYTEFGGNRSNGAGAYIFVGRNQQGEIRRSLLAFKDLSAIPSDANIESVRLHLQLSKKNFNSSASTMMVHRLTSDWGESTSDASGPEGSGTGSAPGDANWNSAFFGETQWNTPGGDFSSTASAQRMIDEIGAVTVNSNAALVSDVQGWLENPGSNFGWILIGDEGVWSARRFGSRNGTTEFTRPMLEVEYSGGGGFVMDAGIGGNWWNGLARNGEGAQIEVADDGDGGLIFIATVYSYDPMGNQIFLIAVGSVDGDTAEVDIFITDGGVWGDDFDPDQVTESQWGTGTFTASSCELINMELRPNAQFQSMGYTDLGYDLVPLTTRAIACPASGGN